MTSVTYTDAHRSFLQYITAKRILTAPEVKAAYMKSCEKYDVDMSAGLQQFVVSINTFLSPINLAIKKSIQEDIKNDQSCFVLVNTISTPATRALASLAPWEENLFQKITEMIMESTEGLVSEVDAVNLGPTLKSKKVSISESEEAVRKILSHKLLLKEDDSLILSGLTLVEQMQLLEANYPEDCIKCFICKIITVRGYSCISCNLKIHRCCGLKLWQQAKKSPYCPNCKAAMNHITPTRRDSNASQ